MPTPRPLLFLSLAAVLGGCGVDAADVPTADARVGAPARTPAPAVTVRTDAGAVPLASYAGQTVVLLFATASAHDAWAALEEARADLEVSGAVVLADTVDGRPSATARAFGYDGAPLAVVVDGEGDLRGRTSPRSSGDLFALAAPVLAEAEVSRSVAWGGAESLDELVQAGGVVVSLDGGAPAPHALRLALVDLRPQDLPADLGTPLAFTGLDAAEAAARAVSWGYAAVFVTEPAGTLVAVEAPAPRPSPTRPGGARG